MAQWVRSGYFTSFFSLFDKMPPLIQSEAVYGGDALGESEVDERFLTSLCLVEEFRDDCQVSLLFFDVGHMRTLFEDDQLGSYDFLMECFGAGRC